MEEKLGIENLKMALGFAIDFGVSLDQKLEDDKLTFWEGLGLVGKTVKLGEVIKNGKNILAEYKDLDDSERDELISFVKEKLDLIDDKLEAIIEKAFEFIANLSEFVDNIVEGTAK